jgi:transcriptional regulator with XRE-family HTH domain
LEDEMEAFGKRVAAVRLEQRISQAELARKTGLGQPRISRIENGALAASVSVTTKLGDALRRNARELVAATDRDGYYVAEALSPEEIADELHMVSLQKSFDIVMLRAFYDRISTLFWAVYGGPYIAVNVNAEALYLDLRSRCARIIENSSLDIPALYFPDHLDPIEEDDVLSWEFIEGDIGRSAMALRHLEHQVNPSLEARQALETLLNDHLEIDVADNDIKLISELVASENRRWLARVDRASRRYAKGFKPPQAPDDDAK